MKAERLVIDSFDRYREQEAWNLFLSELKVFPFSPRPSFCSICVSRSRDRNEEGGMSVPSQ